MLRDGRLKYADCIVSNRKAGRFPAQFETGGLKLGGKPSHFTIRYDAISIF